MNENSWIPISAKLPSVGDIIACAAEHHTGRTMYWAGQITEILSANYAIMEVLEERPRTFILTYDTKWILLPTTSHKCTTSQ